VYCAWPDPLLEVGTPAHDGRHNRRTVVQPGPTALILIAGVPALYGLLFGDNTGRAHYSSFGKILFVPPPPLEDVVTRAVLFHPSAG
jgi:hypothetical protein